MTVSTNTIKTPYYEGDGETYQFPFNFNVTRGEEVVVYVLDDTGASKLTYGSDYTVQFNPESEDGTITLIDSRLLPEGKKLLAIRNTPIVQETDFDSQGRFYPEIHELSFDRAVQILQENAYLKDHAIRFPEYEEPENNVTPSKTDRAGKTLVFDENGGVSVGSANIGDSLMTLQDLINLIQAEVEKFWDNSMTVGGTDGARTLDINTHDDGGGDDGANV